MKFCNSHTQREKTVHMIVVGRVEERGRKRLGKQQKKQQQTNWREGRRETHSIILSKRKEVRSTAAPGITPVIDLLPLPWL